MFLKLIFEENIKKLAFQPDYMDLASLKALVSSIKAWNLQNFDLAVKDSNGRFRKLTESTTEDVFSNHQRDRRFLEVFVQKRDENDCDNSNRNTDDFVDSSVKVNTSFDMTQSFKQCGDDFLANEMSRLQINDNIAGSIVPEDTFVDASHQAVIEPVVFQQINAEDSNLLAEKMEQFDKILEDEHDVRTEKSHKLSIKLRKKQQSEAEHTESKERKTQKLRKRLSKLKKQMNEDIRKTRQLIDERCGSLESQIADLKKQLDIQNQPVRIRSQPQSPVVKCKTTHYGVRCDNCGADPIVGKRFKCMNCSDYDLCETCESKCMHNHPMMRILATQSHQVIDMTVDTRQNRRNSELFVNEFEVEKSEAERPKIESQEMVIEENGNVDEQRKLKTELLDFMFGEAMSKEAKQQFVEINKGDDITEFCAKAQQLNL